LRGSSTAKVPVFAMTCLAARDCGWMSHSVPSRPNTGSAAWNVEMSGRFAIAARNPTMNAGV